MALISLGLVINSCAAESDSSPPTTDEPAAQTSSGNTENPPPDDVILDGCGPNEIDWVVAHGTITNHTSKHSTYFITVEFTADGVRYSEGVAASSTVAPDQVVEWTTVGADDYRQGTECKVISVERFAA